MEMFYPKVDMENPYPVRVVYYGSTSIIVEEGGSDYVLKWNNLAHRYEGKIRNVEGYIYDEV